MKNRQYIVACYENANPENIVQIGVYPTKKGARARARRYTQAERYLKAEGRFTVVVFEAEIVETVQ